MRSSRKSLGAPGNDEKATPRTPLKAIARALFGGAGIAAMVALGGWRTGPVPALGPLLDPMHGLWRAAIPPQVQRHGIVRIPGLSAPVDVRYDLRGVPHIFAATEDDAYRALGYVVARDRLFQLDIQTRAANGTLTEVAGERTLEMDEATRQLGLPRAAERKL